MTLQNDEGGSDALSQQCHLISIIVRHFAVGLLLRVIRLIGLLPVPSPAAADSDEIVDEADRYSQGNVENRRLGIEVCEMIIKWELYQLKISPENHLTVIDLFEQTVKEQDIFNLLPASALTSVTPITNAFAAAQNPTPNNEHIDLQTVDRVVDMLIRMASTVHRF